MRYTDNSAAGNDKSGGRNALSKINAYFCEAETDVATPKGHVGRHKT